jgi:hypothetical protein
MQGGVSLIFKLKEINAYRTALQGRYVKCFCKIYDGMQKNRCKI